MTFLASLVILRPISMDLERSITCQQLQRKVWSIYAQHNLGCGYGAEHIIGRMQNGALVTSRMVRAGADLIVVKQQLLSTAAWGMMTASAMQVDVRQVTEYKYQYGCARCHQIPCTGVLEGGCSELIRPTHPVSYPLPQDINDQQGFFAVVYPGNRTLPMEEVFRRWHEETAELAAACYERSSQLLAKYSHTETQVPYKGESADFMAWLLAAADAIRREDGQFLLGSALKAEFWNGCPYCKSKRCYCPRSETVISRFGSLGQNNLGFLRLRKRA